MARKRNFPVVSHYWRLKIVSMAKNCMMKMKVADNSNNHPDEMTLNWRTTMIVAYRKL